MILPISSLPLSSRHRVSQILFHPTQPYLAVQSHDRSVEIFRIRTEEEVQKKQLRRKRRAKEKKQQEQTKGKGRKADAEPEKDDKDVDDMNVKLVDLFTPYLVVRASGKVRSFDFGPGDVKQKGGTQVLTHIISNAAIITIPSSFLWPWPRMPWKYLTSRSLQNQRMPLKLLAHSLSIFLDIEQTCGHYL
jgi:U3 small nucleolar RNA-associated protein 12